MLFFLSLFKKKKAEEKPKNRIVAPSENRKSIEQIATRKGDLGEYKINIQLDQLSSEYRYISDLLIPNPKARTGYSQIDHVVITPYGIFSIETKNYQGTIYGGKDRKTWSVNGKYNMMNPFVQNYGHIKALSMFIDQKYQQYFISMVSFTKRCTFKVDPELRKITSNELIVYDIELTEFIHRKLSVLKIKHNEPLLNEQEIESIYKAFSNANICDEKVRKEHVNALKSATIDEDKNSQSDSTCVVCNKRVSEKVKAYCLSNKKFNSKIYCFHHQKNV